MTEHPKPPLPKPQLPKYVTMFTDRHGRPRYRYRRKGFPSVYLPGPVGSAAFRQALHAAGRARADPARNTRPGTIDELVTRYCAVPERLGPTPVTRNKVRTVIDHFREVYRSALVADTTFEVIDRILAAQREKRIRHTARGPREVGGIHAARKLRKELVRLFDFAIKIGMITVNPVRIAERVKSGEADRSEGFHSWSESEIARFQQRHPLGTMARLALELMLWTGQRRSDAIRMGPDHVCDDEIRIVTEKTGRQLWIRLAPPLKTAIAAMPKNPDNEPRYYLTTSRGRPFSPNGFGNWFRERCNEAGLSHCTAHGLRKAMMRRLAEAGQSNQAIKAISGHARDDMVTLYTRAADQRRLAREAIVSLAETVANPLPTLQPAP